VEDIQVDPRFEAWSDMQSIHGWLGSPLFVGEEMLGFLSLGSLEPGAFGEADAAMLQAFTRPIAQVLENAWLKEQSSRAPGTGVLSTLTLRWEKQKAGKARFQPSSTRSRFSERQCGIHLAATIERRPEVDSAGTNANR
jgi:transcriptional regulator with GAF, ATPase, and Fis domain